MNHPLFQGQEVGRVVSISAKAPNTLDSILPYQLSPDALKEFKAVFHPIRNGWSEPIIQLLTREGYNISYLNSVMSCLRLAFKGVQLLGPDGDHVAKAKDQYELGVKAFGYGNPTEIEKAVLSFMQRVRSNRNHIILPSHRYAGGFDVKYVGIPNTSMGPLLNPNFRTDYLLSSDADSNQYDVAQQQRAAATEVGKAIIAIFTKMQHLLLDESSSDLASTTKRITRTHPADFNMHDLLAKAFKVPEAAKLGLNFQLPPYNPPETPALDLIKQNFEVLYVREADATAVIRQSRDKEKPVDLLGVSTLNILTAPTIGASVAVNIPKEYACYISQSEKPSLGCLHTYISAWTNSMFKHTSVREGGLRPKNLPTYIFSPSKVDTLVKKRKELGLYVEPGRVNEDGLYITSGGNLAFLPTQENNSNGNAVAYEELMEKALELSFAAGAPLSIDHVGETSPVFGLNKDYSNSIRDLKSKLHKFAGGVQAYNWDLNTVVTVSASEPDKLVSTRLVGGQKPDELNLAHYMRVPFAVAITKMLGNAKTYENQFITPKELGHLGIFRTTVMTALVRVLTFMVNEKKVPTVPELIAVSLKDLGIASASDEKVAAFEMKPDGSTLYSTKPDFSDPRLAVMENQGTLIADFLASAMIDAKGGARSNLARYCSVNNEDIMEDPHFFDAEASSMGEFSNLYNYIGGRVFYHALKALLSIPHKAWISTTLGTDHDHKLPTFNQIATEAYPFAVMLGKYVPEKREEIYEKAEKISTANKEAQHSEEDIHFPGSIGKSANSPGMQLFPHQAETSAILRSHPRFAFLDIAPGGGKTALGLIDIGMLYHEKLIKRPVVICPNNLVANWIEDLHKFTAGKWNAIPITTQTYAEWGDERLTELIKGAPANTILIVGVSFLAKTRKQQLVLGNCVEKVSNALEFLKKFSPDYVIIDEAHRIRNLKSSMHLATKSIATMSSIKYVRLATGTMIQNVLSDVVGQCAMFNGQIFRTKDEFDDEHKGVVAEINGKKVVDYKSDTASKAKRLMSEFCTIISYKRKEWAFMLPTPIETFISVKLEDESKDDPLGRAHRMLYRAILTKTMEELRQNKLITGLLKASSKEDSDEDDEDEEDNNESTNGNSTRTTATGKKIDVAESEDDNENLDALEKTLAPYLQRLERILIDPFGDEKMLEVAKAHFGPGVDGNTFVPAKLRKIYERISKHFTPIEWVKGMKVKAGDMCDHQGESYIYKPDEPFGSNEGISSIPPSATSEDWKPQTRGKILIFCRYIRTVDVIFQHMPKQFADMSVKYHGEVANAVDNLNAFKKDPKIKILIANELGISEGHNLQMASRFIRVEAPWAPGELDQSMSRIFRPDVGGEFKRSSIFLDWILCDGTLEVAKMGRLISKMLRKAQFDELDNPTYFKNLNPRDLPLIKMSLSNIEQLDSLGDLCSIDGSGGIGDIHSDSYIGQYQYLVSQQADEFRGMRKVKRAAMITLEPTPMPADAKILEFTPWIPNLKVPDRNNEGLVALSAQLQEEDDELTQAIAKDVNTLVGMPVRTEFGLGLIKSIRSPKPPKAGGSTAEDGDEDDVVAEATGIKISKVVVNLAQGGTVTVSMSKVYLATKVLPKDIGQLNKFAPKITDKDKAATEKREAKLQKALEAQQRAEEKMRQREQARQDKLDTKRAAQPEPSVAVELHPVVYNGYLALEAITEKEDDVWLKKHGFSKFGSYAFINVPNLKTFESIHDYLDAKFTLQAKTTNLLNRLYDSFASGRGRKFDVELAPLASFPMFYKTRHQLTKVENARKPELKLYPVILNGMLILVVDMATNPVIRKHVGKIIPGCTAKFAVADGLDIIFPHSKRDLIAKVKELKAAGAVITNMDELKEEVAALDFKQVVSK